MIHTASQHTLVLGIAPSTRGFGFAVFETSDSLVDWGVKSVTTDKNIQSLTKIEELICHYQPDAIVIENSFVKESARAARIKKLHREIIAMAKKHGVRMRVLSRLQIRRSLLPHGVGTKHAVAEILAKRFPAELGLRLPPKRLPWKSEAARMDIFDAIALCVAYVEVRTH
jgi:Holliday junction resolvasome RuvABC endonuclease subunit